MPSLLTLSDALAKEISQAISSKSPPKLPEPFTTEIARALETYLAMSTRSPSLRNEEETIQRALRLTIAYRKELKTALRTLDHVRYSDLHLALTHIASEIDTDLMILGDFGWDAEWTPIHVGLGRGRDLSDEARQMLRVMVMGALEDHADVEVRASSRRGPAARVVAIVLNEADRKERKPGRKRDEFNLTQWRKWVREYHSYRAVDVAFGPGPSRFMTKGVSNSK